MCVRVLIFKLLASGVDKEMARNTVHPDEELARAQIIAEPLVQQPHSYPPAHVSIRQHTSAYVSIRQHMPAYVSKRTCGRRRHR